MLAVVAHQVDTPHPGILARQLFNGFPAIIRAAIVDEHYFIGIRKRGKYLAQSFDQHSESLFTAINRYDDGNVHTGHNSTIRLSAGLSPRSASPGGPGRRVHASPPG